MTQDVQTIINISSFIIGIIGVILAFIFYFKTKKNKQAFYEIKTNNLISKLYGEKISELEIYFNKVKINKLSMSRVVIWNAGNETINNTDIPQKEKFYLSGNNNVVIYSIIIVENTDNSNNLKIIQDNLKYYIEFEYLDSHQGFTLQILHSGDHSYDLSLGGKLKGGYRLKKYNGYHFNGIYDIIFLYITPFIGIFGIFFIYFFLKLPLGLQLINTFLCFFIVFIGVYGLSLKKIPVRFIKSLNKK